MTNTNQLKRVILSSKQYNMLRICLNERVLTQDAATKYLQPTFTSMARRGYLATQLNGKTGDVEFYATSQAKAAMMQFENSDVMRTNTSSSLSEFLTRYVKRSIRKVSA